MSQYNSQGSALPLPGFTAKGGRCTGAKVNGAIWQGGDGKRDKTFTCRRATATLNLFPGQLSQIGSIRQNLYKQL